ncbi:MAG: hypothetical protein CXR31_05250 [Geobacter sp.]|nr:MAG: hypothetical protein CXR31_05250 [Geobacter sp.]
MSRKLIFTLCLVLFSVATVMAEDTGPTATTAAVAVTKTGAANGNATTAANGTGSTGDSDAKTLRGMSVLGNNEAPMSLFIVPWKSSELGVEANLTRTLNERDMPVDREVFMREIAFYQVSVGSKAPLPAAGAKMSKVD